MSTLVYRYGLLAPTLGAEKVRSILDTAHRFSNTRVEIERGRRAALREIESRVGLAPLLAAHADADAWCSYGCDVIRAHKSEQRTNKVPDEMREALAECKRWRAAASAQIREAKRVMRERHGIAYDAVNGTATDLRRNARGYSGLASAGPHYGAHGTYQVVEDATDKLAKRPLYNPTRGWSANDPRYRRKSGALHVHDGRVERDAEGTIAVQIQGGASVAELATHTQLQIVQRARGNTQPDSRRGKQGRTLRMRVGSTDPSGRDGIYAEWPMVMHRPLPADALIMNARVHVRRVGTRDEWCVTMTVRTGVDRAPAERVGAVAINIGWRRVPSGIRVATWVGEDGGRGEIVCDSSVLDRLEHAASVRSLRDELFNVARDWAADVVASVDAPEWLRRDTATLRQWRSTERLRDVAYIWSKRRFAGDEAAYAAVHEWAKRDRHLYQYEVGERGSAERHRREVYRVAASHLAGRYTTLVHDGVDLAAMKTCPMVDADGKDNPRARANMHASAPGEMRDALVNAFRGDVVEENAVDITHTCPECGVVESFDAAINIWHRCRACAALWDQDFAAAENLLERHRERRGGALDPATARNDSEPENKESPRARSKRMAKERTERLAAREPGDKAAE